MVDTSAAASLAYIEARVANDGPNQGTAYLWWWLAGLVGGHRFYLKGPLNGLLFLCSWVLLIPVVWWPIDFFLIPSMVRAKRQKLRDQFLMA